MKSNNEKATSIIEAIIVILIMTMWILWMFKVFSSSMKLSNTTANRITAIQIAREWIEAMENIRWTNWIKYSSDYTNCWNTLNYNPLCVNNTTITHDIPHNSSFVLKTDTYNRWTLSWSNSLASDFTSTNYRNSFRVKKDTLWFYTQSWWIDFLPIFTREIKIEYINTNWWTVDSNDEKMLVTSLVQWVDSSSKKAHKVELESMLSNWRK